MLSRLASEFRGRKENHDVELTLSWRDEGNHGGRQGQARVGVGNTSNCLIRSPSF